MLALVLSNYEALGPIPQGMRVQIWHTLIPARQEIKNEPEDLDVYAIIDRLFDQIVHK
jgi:hypothetical protein